MIYKMRRTPKKLLGLTALFDRLHQGHEKSKSIEDQLARVKAGYGGESNFDKYLLEFSPRYPHAILHDLCLEQDNVLFQMDSILITPAAIIIFEVKNIAGKLLFMDKPDRFVRQLATGETQSMQSPIAQLDRKKYFLGEWLIKRGIHTPIKGVVALAYSNEIQPVSIPENHITFAYQVPNYLYSLSMHEGSLNAKTIKNLASDMIRNHLEYNPFPMLKTWDIPSKDIQLGVKCPGCNSFEMQWIRQKWRCQKCAENCSDSHIAAIKDWFYLIDSKLTNSDFRKFAKIDNQQVVKRLLKNLDLQLKGKQKGSYYVMKEE